MSLCLFLKIISFTMSINIQIAFLVLFLLLQLLAMMILLHLFVKLTIRSLQILCAGSRLSMSVAYRVVVSCYCSLAWWCRFLPIHHDDDDNNDDYEWDKGHDIDIDIDTDWDDYYCQEENESVNVVSRWCPFLLAYDDKDIDNENENGDVWDNYYCHEDDENVNVVPQWCPFLLTNDDNDIDEMNGNGDAYADHYFQEDDEWHDIDDMNTWDAYYFLEEKNEIKEKDTMEDFSFHQDNENMNVMENFDEGNGDVMDINCSQQDKTSTYNGTPCASSLPSFGRPPRYPIMLPAKINKNNGQQEKIPTVMLPMKDELEDDSIQPKCPINGFTETTTSTTPCKSNSALGNCTTIDCSIPLFSVNDKEEGHCDTMDDESDDDSCGDFYFKQQIDNHLFVFSNDDGEDDDKEEYHLNTTDDESDDDSCGDFYFDQQQQNADQNDDCLFYLSDDEDDENDKEFYSNTNAEMNDNDDDDDEDDESLAFEFSDYDDMIFDNNDSNSNNCDDIVPDLIDDDKIFLSDSDDNSYNCSGSSGDHIDTAEGDSEGLGTLTALKEDEMIQPFLPSNAEISSGNVEGDNDSLGMLMGPTKEETLGPSILLNSEINNSTGSKYCVVDGFQQPVRRSCRKMRSCIHQKDESTATIPASCVCPKRRSQRLASKVRPCYKI